MTKPSPKFYISDSEKLSEEDPDKVDRLTHEATGTRTSRNKQEIDDAQDGSPLEANTSLPVETTNHYNYRTPGAPMESQFKTLRKAPDNLLKQPDVTLEIKEATEDKKVVEARRKRTRYIPSCNQDENCTDTHIEDEENSPLLDVSNDIEQNSEDWPIDPDA